MEDRAPVVSPTEQSSPSTTTTSAMRRHEGRGAWVLTAYGISGLFDLRPLVNTSINKALHLDEATARAASPGRFACAKVYSR